MNIRRMNYVPLKKEIFLIDLTPDERAEKEITDIYKQHGLWDGPIALGHMIEDYLEKNCWVDIYEVEYIEPTQEFCIFWFSIYENKQHTFTFSVGG